MGDRANIVIESDTDMFPSPVYFYTHWSGYSIKASLKKALIKGRERWDDPQYLARVIFQTLIGKDNDVIGFGISTKIGDNDRPLITVSMKERKVRQRGQSLESQPTQEWTFEEFTTTKFKSEEDEE